MSAKGQKWTEQQRKSFSEKCKATKCNNQKIWTDELREKARLKAIESNNKYWTKERRQQQSIRMQEIVQKNPASYSKNNVSGRVKMYDTFDFHGATRVKGTWELKVANWLNQNNIKWSNSIEPIKYQFNGITHSYFPDFYLIDFDILIEVKGFETDKDISKWEATNKILHVLKKEDIKLLDETMSKILHK